MPPGGTWRCLKEEPGNVSRRTQEMLPGGTQRWCEEEPGDASRRNLEIFWSLWAPAHPTVEWFFPLCLRSSFNPCWIPDLILRIPTDPWLGAAAQKGFAVHFQCPQNKPGTTRVFFSGVAVSLLGSFSQQVWVRFSMAFPSHHSSMCRAKGNMGMASRISAAPNGIFQSHHGEPEPGAFPSTKGPGKQILDDPEFMECFFHHLSFFPTGISAPWDQTSQMFLTTPQCLEDAPFPLSCFKHLFQSSWWENPFVLKACKLKTGIKQLFLRIFWRSQGRERRSCCCCFLELLLGREGWICSNILGGIRASFQPYNKSCCQEIFLCGTSGICCSVQENRAPCYWSGGRADFSVWQQNWKMKWKKKKKTTTFCLDHAGILFLLLNKIHCSIGCELFHPIPNGMGWFIQDGKGEIHKHLMEPEDCSSSCLEILMFLWKSHVPGGRSHESMKTRNVPFPALPCSGSHNSFENQECSLPCSAGCKWWETVDEGNGPILPSFPFLMSLRTSFQPFQPLG